MSSVIEFALTRHQVVVTDQIVSEVRAFTRRKNPTRLEAVEAFLSDSRLEHAGSDSSSGFRAITIRDETDQGILDNALSAGVDIVLSGDADFLVLEINFPRIMSPAEFIAEFIDQ